MAGLFASMAVKWAIDKLSSLLTPVRQTPVASSSSSSSSSQGLDDLRMLERTMRRIHATLMDAEEHWNIREESAKLRLRELKELAYGAKDVVEEYEYEVNSADWRLPTDVQATVLSASAMRSTTSSLLNLDWSRFHMSWVFEQGNLYRDLMR